jgi:protein ImuB
MREALAPLPLAALRLPPETVAALADVGLHRIADVLDLPRAVLAARFEASFLCRLDQALGRANEPIAPRRPAPSFMAEQHFAEPIARERDVLGTIARLGIRLGYAMEARGEGARLLEVALFRTDGKVCRIAVGTGAPLREASRINRLFADRLAAIGEARDPGFGYDLVRLSAPVTERCAPVQTDLAAADAPTEQAAEIGYLIDRLGARFGLRRVTRLALQDTHIPEFAVASVPAHAAQSTLPAGRGNTVHAGAQLPPPPPLRGRLTIANGIAKPQRDISPSPLAGEGGEDRRSEPGEGDRRNALIERPHPSRSARLPPPQAGEGWGGGARRPLPRGERDYEHRRLAHPAQDTLAPARPARLFARPERIEAIAEVPDGPPARFRWRRVLHEVMAAEGPERIALEWWRDADGCVLTRDYFRIETRAGMRVWLYREGLYGRETGEPRWFLHGLFG